MSSIFKKIFKKPVILKVFFAVCVVLLLFITLLFLLSFGPFDRKAEKITWGVTFSKPYAQSLELDWKETYLAILNDLGARHVRIPAYWDELEGSKDVFHFEDLDWQVDEAGKRGAKIIISIGRRLPRWPECHVPPWVEQESEEFQQERILVMLEKVVDRYKDYPAIRAWQVENEPFLRFFGICPAPDEDFFKKEVGLVKSLDPLRPIIVSDSGELSTWLTASKYGDIFGTTMYRVVPSALFGGYTTYPLPSWFYRKKANVVSKFRPLEELIVVELQAEAWAAKKFIGHMTREESYESMSPEQFRKNIQYGRDSGIGEIYLWGAEWWFWLKEVKSDSRIWDEARKLFEE